MWNGQAAVPHLGVLGGRRQLATVPGHIGLAGGGPKPELAARPAQGDINSLGHVVERLPLRIDLPHPSSIMMVRIVLVRP